MSQLVNVSLCTDQSAHVTVYLRDHIACEIIAIWALRVIFRRVSFRILERHPRAGMDAHKTVVDLDSDRDDGETAEAGGARDYTCGLPQRVAHGTG